VTEKEKLQFIHSANKKTTAETSLLILQIIVLNLSDRHNELALHVERRDNFQNFEVRKRRVRVRD
jgi:hypothetical protein